MIELMEPSGRWWRVDGHEVDLNSGPHYPPLVRAAVLAHRDASTPEAHDLAALLAWAVEEHPLWTGACPVDGVVCETNQQAGRLATEWMFTRSQQLRERITATLDGHGRRAA